MRIWVADLSWTHVFSRSGTKDDVAGAFFMPYCFRVHEIPAGRSAGPERDPCGQIFLVGGTKFKNGGVDPSVKNIYDSK